MKFAVCGVTLTGNLGGTAMLLTVRQEIRARFPGATIDLLSISPAQDLAAPQVEGVRVVRAPWLALVAAYLPLSVIAAPLRRWSICRAALRRIPYFRALLEADGVIDVCGIAFVDGRGPGLLAYNLACCAPAILLGTPVFKLAQTLGPFRRPLNRACARWALDRCRGVVGRGDACGRDLAELGLRRVRAIATPDITFCLEVPAAERAWARAQIESAGFTSPPIILSPSRVLQRACAAHGIDLAGIFAQTVRTMRARGRGVALLAHSSAAGISKNDDPAVCREIALRLPPELRPAVLETTDPVRARAIIGLAEIFVGCRYHALVSAYAEGVPSISLSWNMKYEDLARAFDREHWVLESQQVRAEALEALMLELDRGLDAEIAALRSKLPAVRACAAANFTMIADAFGVRTR